MGASPFNAEFCGYPGGEEFFRVLRGHLWFSALPLEMGHRTAGLGCSTFYALSHPPMCGHQRVQGPFW